ncbi:Alpha/beta hydrolase [Paenibacillus typhae]|uniref:Alpha/beta hydrolase n=1 Tax=Paenibacillus typhae TaxID=1174501 RepID=A0A1G8LLS6_9BACL|nr:hypothetical protein SAMN05216192_106164 [Paenibacillus typhae]
MGSIFKTEAGEEEYYLCYEKSLECLELEGTSYYIATASGDTYVTRFGDPRKEPLLLLHGIPALDCRGKPFPDDGARRYGE